MSREARKISNTGIYHAMLRGINKQQIFEDSEDYEKFLQIIHECKEIVYKVYKCSSVAEFQKLDIKYRDIYLRKLKDKGLSIRQISRLTGATFGIVRKMCVI